jgi:aspartate aminotransferase-like enzyme
MGLAASPPFVLGVLSALELALRDLGAPVDPGAGVAAAQRALAGMRASADE